MVSPSESPYTFTEVADQELPHGLTIQDRGLSDKLVDLVTGVKELLEQAQGGGDNRRTGVQPRQDARAHRPSYEGQRPQMAAYPSPTPPPNYFKPTNNVRPSPQLSPIAPNAGGRRPTAVADLPYRPTEFRRPTHPTTHNENRRPTNEAPRYANEYRLNTVDPNGRQHHNKMAVTPQGEVIDPEELKRRIQFVQRVMPNISSMEIMETLKANDFHIKKTVEVLVDRLTMKASQMVESKAMVQQSMRLFEQEKKQQPNTAIQNSFVMALEHGGPERVPTYGEGYHPALFVSQAPNDLVPPSGNKKALLIGINYYGSKKELNGCCDDVDRIKLLMTQVYGFLDVPPRMTVLTDRPGGDPRLLPTRHNVLTAMKWLISGAKSGDVLFFHYSGHGGQKKDLAGTEIDGYDETIMPVDYKRAGHITDDEIHDVMIKHLPSGVKLVCVMDCCHSGSGMDLPFYWEGSKRNWATEPFPKYSEGDVVLFSSCQDAETAADLKIPSWGSGGAVTLSLVTALSQNPFHWSFYELLKQVETFLGNNKFKQQPQVSATQKFDMNRTKFNMTDILPNKNELVGYKRNQARRPARPSPAGRY